MGDDKKKKSGGLKGLLFKLVILVVLLGVAGELAARFTGNYDLSPITQIQRLF